jgi:sarcosine/dimethylglycine N-methyltransferase
VTQRQVEGQYTTGLSRRNIGQALVTAGMDLGSLRPKDLAVVEDFHTLGRIATSQLADLAKITSRDAVLDAGSGIGGTARFLADRFGCAITTIDLTEEYCKTARWLNELVGLGDRITIYRGDVTQLPLPDAGFDVVVSQHVQMNVEDKSSLYREARRVLVPGGRLALWDITRGRREPLDFPMPWADRPAMSHLVSAEELHALIVDAGFAVHHWNDLTEDAATFMESLLSVPPGPLGLHAFVPDFAQKVTNLTRGLSDGRLRAIQGVALAGG